MEGTSPDTTPDVGATGIGRLRFFVSTLPAGGRQATNLFKGTDGPPTSRSIRPAQEKSGTTYRARATWSRSVRSSRRGHGRQRAGGKAVHGRRDTGVNRSTGTVRYARCADAEAAPETIHDTGEPSSVNAARSVREGVVRKGPGNRNLAGDLLHVEHAGSDWDADGVVGQREERALADVARGGTGLSEGGDHAGEEAGDQGDAGASIATSVPLAGAGADGQADVGLGESQGQRSPAARPPAGERRSAVAAGLGTAGPSAVSHRRRGKACRRRGWWVLDRTLMVVVTQVELAGQPSTRKQQEDGEWKGTAMMGYGW